MADISELPPNGKRLEARAVLLNTWHRLLAVHDALDLNDPESLAIADVTTLIADRIQGIEGKRPRRSRHFAVTVVVEASSASEAQEFSHTIGAGPGDQWDHPLTICGPARVAPTPDPAAVEAGGMSSSDGLGTLDAAEGEGRR